MLKNTFILKAGIAALVALSSASCSSTAFYSNGDVGNRYGEPAPRVERRVGGPYSHWTMNSYEREAEKKAIAQDQPFATVRPSRY